MPEIRMESVTKRFGDITACDELSIDIKSGEYFCLLGPSGSGKTTCMRMICGLTEVDSGHIYFDDKEVTDLPSNERNATMLLQSYALFPKMDVVHNVIFSPRIKGWDEEETQKVAKAMITMVHMNKFSRSMPQGLSGGQQQRVALARALTSGSQVLLLDEPLRALDARLRIELRKELRAMVKDTGVTAIHVTHDQEEALEIADRIAIINDGRIIQVGTPKEIFEHPNCPFVADFVGRANIVKGVVKSVGSDGVVATIGNGIDVPIDDKGHKAGDRILVSVKIGNTKISNNKPGFFKGTIMRKLYEGVMFVIEMKVEGLDELFVTRLPNRKYDDYEIGTDVSIYWTPSKANIFDDGGDGDAEH